MVTDTKWMARAVCRHHGGTALFFSEAMVDVAAAAAICAVCPVRGECGRAAEHNRERFGVWAGKARHPVKARRKSVA